MKRLTLIALTIVAAGCFSSALKAQQIPLYSQYHNNPFLYNPARAGETTNLQVNGIYRKQWTDFNGAPETRALTLDGAIQNKRIGLGGYLFSDNTDILERLGGKASYAYHLPLGSNKQHTVSLGISVGFEQVGIDEQRIEVTDPQDPLVRNNLSNGGAFDASAGLNYSFKGLNLGVSVPQIIGNELSFVTNKNEGGANYQLSRHYLVNGSYNIPVIEDKFYIEPGAMFRMTPGTNFQIDGRATFKYKDIAWLSGTYRYDYAVTIGGGVQVHDRVSVGYAYDLAINNISDYSGGTHEVMVGITFGKTDERKDLIQELKNNVDTIRMKQAEQGKKIDEVSEQNDTLMEQNRDFKETIEKQEEEIEQLKEKINKEVDEFRDTIQKMREQGGGFGQKGGKNSKYTDSKGRPLPEDMVKEVDWEDTEFIYGKSNDPYFMTVASFREAERAKKKADELNAQGHNTGVVYNKEREWFYVFLKKPGSVENGLRKLRELKQNNPEDFGDAWIHVYK